MLPPKQPIPTPAGRPRITMQPPLILTRRKTRFRRKHTSRNLPKCPSLLSKPPGSRRLPCHLKALSSRKSRNIRSSRRLRNIPSSPNILSSPKGRSSPRKILTPKTKPPCQ